MQCETCEKQEIERLSKCSGCCSIRSTSSKVFYWSSDKKKSIICNECRMYDIAESLEAIERSVGYIRDSLNLEKFK